MSQSVGEIKKILENTAFEGLPQVLDGYRQDTRKGVQTLIATYEKKQVKHQKEVQRIQGLWEYEQIYAEKGYRLIAGLDEVGRGPLAGPVVAAAVILPLGLMIGVNDSKKLSPEKRECLYEEIQEKAVGIGIGIIEPKVIDEVNILEATKLAMLQALDQLKTAGTSPDYLLLDALTLNHRAPQRPIIGGDGKSASIAAASIIAKVTRDRIMADYHAQYPAYHFDANKGYGTEVHMLAIRKQGLSPIHRRSFLKGY